MTLVVLPGLDGTGTLHAEFFEAAGHHFQRLQVVVYPNDRTLDYAELGIHVRERLPVDGPFVLLGESFSGPVAIAIAAEPPRNLSALVLTTTFAKSAAPALSWTSRWLRFLPVHGVPRTLTSWWLLGAWATGALESRLASALASVHAKVLRHRVGLALRADVSGCLPRVSVPTLYLRGAADRLLSSRHGDAIVQAVPHACLVDLPGPHLLLQAAPDAAASAIAEFIARSVAAR